MDLAQMIRDVPDFPVEGIIFKDITTLLKDAAAFRVAVDALAQNYAGKKIDKIVAVEARGYIFGAVLAYQLGTGFVPIRKPGKLPAKTVRETYELEYGTDTIEIHKDAIAPGEQILVVDDLLATGGTTRATIKLVEKLGGEVMSVACLIELTFLNGRDKLQGYDVCAVIKY